MIPFSDTERRIFMKLRTSRNRFRPFLTLMSEATIKIINRAIYVWDRFRKEMISALRSCSRIDGGATGRLVI
jgi:hypothetical protein